MKHESMIGRGLRAASLALACILLAVPAMAAGVVNRDADEILRDMSKFLAGTKAFSVSVDASIEVVTKEGQKLQMVNSASVLLERPSRFYSDPTREVCRYGGLLRWQEADVLRQDRECLHPAGRCRPDR